MNLPEDRDKVLEGKTFTIAFDMDGTIVGFEDGIVKYIQEHYPYLKEEINIYNFQQIAQKNKIEIKDIYRNVPGFYYNLKFLPGAKELIIELGKIFNIYFCSTPAKSRTGHSEKYNFLLDHLGYEFASNLVLIEDKTKFICDILIDDNIQKKKDNSPHQPVWQQILYLRPSDKLENYPHMTVINNYMDRNHINVIKQMAYDIIMNRII